MLAPKAGSFQYTGLTLRLEVICWLTRVREVFLEVVARWRADLRSE